MDVIKVGAMVAGAAVGGYAGYMASDGEEVLMQAGATLIGAAVGAVGMMLVEQVVTEHNPIAQILG